MEKQDEKDKNLLNPSTEDLANAFSEPQEVESLEELIKAQSKPKAADEEEDPEEVTEDTEEVDEGAKPDETTEDVSEESNIKVFAQMLSEQGIIDFKEDEFEDEDSFLVNKFAESVNKRAEELLDEVLPDELKQLVANYKKGVPLDELIKSESNKIRYDNIKPEDLESDEEMQEKLVRNKLKLDDLTDAEVDEAIEDLKDNNLLAKQAKLAIKALKKQEDLKIAALERQQELAQEKQQKEAENRINKLHADIFTKDEIIPGIKLTKEDKEKFFNGITKPGKDGLTELYKKAKADPDWELKSAYFLLMMDGKIDKISQKNKSEVVSKFKASADKQKEVKNTKLNLSAIERALSLH